MRNAIIGALLACGWFGPPAAAAPCVPPPHEAEDAEAALRNAYAAAQSLDEPGWHNAITEDFYAYDGGRRFDGDGMFAIVKSARAAGKTYHWTLANMDAHATCGVVWIAYENHGSVTTPAGSTQLSWLESAILRRDNGVWKIAFLHSTRVPPKS